jgi:hypothetical protein
MGRPARPRLNRLAGVTPAVGSSSSRRLPPYAAAALATNALISVGNTVKITNSDAALRAALTACFELRPRCLFAGDRVSHSLVGARLQGSRRVSDRLRQVGSRTIKPHGIAAEKCR